LVRNFRRGSVNEAVEAVCELQSNYDQQVSAWILRGLFNMHR
jgi:hypothetical protein